MNPSTLHPALWAISLIGFSQFWIWMLWRRFAPARPLEIFPARNLEIGFDENGPVVAVAGIIRSPDDQVFIQSMELKLTHEKGKSTRTYRWLAFKPDFLLPNHAARSWEMPHPFMVSMGEARKFNIVFNDVDAFPNVKGILATYYHHWHETELRIQERRDRLNGDSGLTDQGDLVSEFKHRDVCVAAYTELDRKCYWEPGVYDLSLAVHGENGALAATSNSRFTLEKSDTQILKSNCVLMLDEPIAAVLGKRLAPCKSVQVEGMPLPK